MASLDQERAYHEQSRYSADPPPEPEPDYSDSDSDDPEQPKQQDEDDKPKNLLSELLNFHIKEDQGGSGHTSSGPGSTGKPYDPMKEAFRVKEDPKKLRSTRPQARHMKASPGQSQEMPTSNSAVGNRALHNMQALRNKRVFEDCREGNVWKVKSFVECGGDPNITDENGHSLLYTAILARSPQIVRYLVAKGAAVDYTEMQTAINNSTIENEEDFLVPTNRQQRL